MMLLVVFLSLIGLSLGQVFLPPSTPYRLPAQADVQWYSDPPTKNKHAAYEFSLAFNKTKFDFGSLVVTTPVHIYTVQHPYSCMRSSYQKPGSAGFERLQMTGCQPNQNNREIEIEYESWDDSVDMGVVSLVVEIPVLPQSAEHPYPGPWKIKFPSDDTVYELEWPRVLAVKGGHDARKVGGHIYSAVSNPSEVTKGSVNRLQFTFTLSTPISKAKQAIHVRVQEPFKLKGGACASGAVSIENCDRAPCSALAAMECSYKTSGGWVVFTAKNSLQVSTVRVNAIYESPAEARSDLLVQVFTVEDATKPFEYTHEQFLTSPNTRDYGEISLNVRTETIFRPTHGGTPFKPGQVGAHAELMFVGYTPKPQEQFDLTLPVGFSFTNQWECGGRVGAPHSHVLNVLSCAAPEGPPGGRVMGGMTVGCDAVAKGDWVLATDINVPLNPPEEDFAWYVWGISDNSETLHFPTNYVKGSLNTHLAGGDRVTAVMRPSSLEVGQRTKVSFIFELTSVLSSNGGLVIVPPTDLSLASGGCKDSSIDVSVLNIIDESGESVSANGSGNWQCARKGPNGILLKRISHTPASHSLKVSFYLTLTRGNIEGLAGSAAIFTCTNADSCDAVDHRRYLADPNFVDYGLTKDDVSVPLDL
eukprot:Filipodium_phascolosomae@DN2723_c0_g1_i1.p1